MKTTDGPVKRLLNWLRSWRLLSLRSFIVAALALYAAVGFFVVPPVAKKLIIDTLHRRTGRDVAVEAVHCNPFILSLTIRGFSMTDRPGSTLLRFDSLYVNAQLSSLFRWAAVVKELRIENLYVGLRRFADGEINVRELLEDIERLTPADDTTDAADGRETAGLPRSLLQHILVSGATIEIEDHDRDEALTLEYGPSVFELHEISTLPDRKGDNEFVIGLQDGGTVRIVGEVVVEPLGLVGTVSADRIFLDNLWPILEPYFEFDVVTGQAAGRLDYSVQLAGDGLHVRIDGLDADLSGLSLQARDSEVDVLEVDAARIADGRLRWPEGEVGAARVDVEGAKTFTWLEPDGSFSWEVLVPKTTQVEVVEIYEQVKEALPWKATVDRFEVRGASARLEDRTFGEPLTLTVEGANLSVTGITTEPGGLWSLEMSATLPGGAAATAEGTFGIGPVSLDARVGVRELDLIPFQPYLGRLAPVELVAGRLESSGFIRFAPHGDGSVGSFSGDVAIDGFELGETAVGSRLLRWKRVEVQGIEAAHAPQSLRIDEIDVRGAGIEIVLAEGNRVNLVELIAAVIGRSEGTETAESAEPATQDEPYLLPPITVGVVALHGCSGAYIDRTFASPFTLALDPIEGTIEGISTSSTAGAEFEIEGTVSSGGVVVVNGEIDLFDPGRMARVSIDVHEAGVPPLSPMAVRYLGHPVERGTADVALDYEILANRLTGRNRIVTQDLALGVKVEGEGMIGLPVKLGVSLLTDKNGRITLEFPVEGSLDDPDFGVGRAIGSATKDVVGSLVKSPFRLLGKLGGGKERDDYGYVEFAAGRADLGPTSEAKLRTLAAGAAQRPELILQVAGAWAPKVDIAALREAALDRTLADRSSRPAEGPDGAGTSPGLELLESLYLESTSAEALDRVRTAYTSTAGATGEEPTLDEMSYYRELRRQLIAAQTVGEAALRTLGAARVEAIRALLVDEAGVDAARVQVTDPVATPPAGEEWVRVQLEVSAGD